MKKVIPTLLLGFALFVGHAQEQFVFTVDEYQIVQDPNTLSYSQMRFPGKAVMIPIGGINDLKGIGNYFDVFDTKLLVDTMNTTTNGEYNITLRREDGRNFYNLFPTLQATLVPQLDAVPNQMTEQ